MLEFYNKEYTFGNEYTSFKIQLCFNESNGEKRIDCIGLFLTNCLGLNFNYLMSVDLWTRFVRFINQVDLMVKDN